MATKLWLAAGTVLPNGLKITKMIANGDEWQISSTSGEGYALLVNPCLYQKWLSSGLIADNLFTQVSTEKTECFVFSCKHGYLISSVECGPYPTMSMEARAFAAALRETRKIDRSIPLHDAVYIELLSRLLPTYTTSKSFDDKTVLGTWLTSGVSISVDSYQRLCILLNWMDTKEVESIVNEAGFLIRCGKDIAKANFKEYEKEEDQFEHSKAHIKGDIPKTRFSLPGRPELEAFFNDHIIDIVLNEDKYKRMGIEFPGAVVLHGPPGCGKTYAAERLIEYLDWPSYSIDSSSVGSPYIHDTSKKIAQIFDIAINNAPSVIVIDEMEAFLTDRKTGQSSGLHHVEEVAEFLRRIPEASKKRVLVIAMTNMIDTIDPAILRRGRFDHTIEVKMPSKEEVEILLKSIMDKLPVSDDVELPALADKLVGRPLSDIAFAVREAGRMAVKENKDKIDNSILSLVFGMLPALK